MNVRLTSADAETDWEDEPSLLSTSLGARHPLCPTRRTRSLALSGLLSFTLLALTQVGLPAPVAAATTIAATTSCSNDVDNTGGLGLICEVTIDNTFTATGGSASVTVRECHGPAGNPEASCVITSMVLAEPVTSVTQCNNSINGGGGTLRCSVTVNNAFVGVPSTVTAATVNQCVGSGDGITVGCNPFPATTTGATITQCNGSANGGTLVGLTCVANGTQSSSASVLVNQCNDSANGGGGLVICSATIANGASAVVPTPTPTPSPTPVPSAQSPSPTPSSGSSTAPAPSIVSPTTPAAVTLPPTDSRPLERTESAATGALLASFAILLAVVLGSAVIGGRSASRGR